MSNEANKLTGAYYNCFMQKRLNSVFYSHVMATMSHAFASNYIILNALKVLTNEKSVEKKGIISD